MSIDDKEFEAIDNLPIEEAGQVQFNTAILTYPSDFNNFLSVGIITEFLEEKFKNKKGIKVVVAREDADEKIQRNHFHIYIDTKRQLKVSARKYFDIKLPHKLVVLVGFDNKRTYEDYDELESKLGWDNYVEMAAKLSSYCDEKGYKHADVLETCHPNLQIKKRYGSKYQMLRYVVKQGLVARSNFDIRKELEYLKENEQKLINNFENLEKDGKLSTQGDIDVYEELLYLCQDYIRKTTREMKKSQQLEDDFIEWCRVKIEEERLTENEVINEIKKSAEKFNVFAKNYINYSKLIGDMFKKQIVKPDVDYEFHSHWYLPKKLYDYLMWLDKWVKKYMTGTLTKEDYKGRLKSLVIIGRSRTGKTELALQFGLFTYMANMWIMDQWENKAAYTIMDDIDPNTTNIEKGLNFTWFKGFFGCQKSIGMTDKYRGKKLVENGKPLIWLSNYELDEVFKNPKDVEYIEDNCIVIRLTRPLYQKPEPMDWIEGHSDFIEYDTKNTWYYQNVILPNLQPKVDPNKQFNEPDSNKENEDPDDLMPLSERKRKLSITEESKEKFEQDKGRLLQELEEKIEKINYYMNEEEILKNKLETDLNYINHEYETCKHLFVRNKEYVNYQQTLIDKTFELCNEINYSLVRLDKYMELKELYIRCYYYVDKSTYE